MPPRRCNPAGIRRTVVVHRILIEIERLRIGATAGIAIAAQLEDPLPIKVHTDALIIQAFAKQTW